MARYFFHDWFTIHFEGMGKMIQVFILFSNWIDPNANFQKRELAAFGAVLMVPLQGLIKSVALAGQLSPTTTIYAGLSRPLLRIAVSSLVSVAQGSPVLSSLFAWTRALANRTIKKMVFLATRARRPKVLKLFLKKSVKNLEL